jgi:serine/threonine-protein kinase
MATSDESRIGHVIASKYRLDEELGRGGMGAVYRAFHLRVHKVFALKMLLGEVAKHRSIASRFLLEAQAAGRIGHPGILDVYDVGEEADGTPFIVMELLRGEPLSTLVHREKLEVDAAVWIAMEVLDILSAAHAAGIIHRDVKPQNVFLTEKEDGARGVKLLDFGIAKFSGVAADGSALTRSGEIIGSPLYMAPEQAKGENVDERADVWSVGAMLFEMLTGKCAHAATTPVAVLAKILTEPAPPASSKDARVPTAVDDVVAKALRIDRAERWPTAKAMREALAEVRTSTEVPSLPKPVKESKPPTSVDRTPGAITSTVAEPPRSRLKAGSKPPDAAAMAKTELAPAPPAPPDPFMRRLAMIAAVAGAVIAVLVLPKWLRGDAPPAPAPAPLVQVVSVAAPAPPPPVSVVPVASAALPEPEPAGMVDAGASPRPAAAPACPRGLVWQNGRCERPLAKTFE